MGSDPLVEESTEAADLLPIRDTDELDILKFSESDSTYPWSAVLDEALMHRYGLGDYIQDSTEAMRLFRQAARLGSLSAYGHIGNMHATGEGTRQDLSKALEIYKEGVRQGSVYCYWKMGILFAFEESKENAEKCFSLFVKNIPVKLPDSQRLTDLELSDVRTDCIRLIVYKKEILSNLHGFIAEQSTEIYQKVMRFIELSRLHGKSSMENDYLAAIEYMEKIVSLETDKFQAL